MQTQNFHLAGEILIHAAVRPRRVTDVAGQMLANAGYDVVPVPTTDALFERLANNKVELLVLGGTSDDSNMILDRLATLPDCQRPQRVAILTDDLGADSTPLNRKLPGTKVYLLVTPLHAYGLLNIVRRIRRSAMVASN